ncbi:MAG: BamA/TamA family outer membrane protein [Proteobacteria bacterium]|nr:BamA/TamA family outer membrane protein [Pseudomonadota bacterium]
MTARRDLLKGAAALSLAPHLPGQAQSPAATTTTATNTPARSWQNWSGIAACTPRQWLLPADEAELARLLPKSPGPLRSVGAGHSFTALVPTSGNFQRLTAEWSAVGEVQYVRSTYQYQHYFPLTKQYTFAFNGELGLGKAIGERPYPLFKNFYGGGLGSLRGFEAGSLGPRDPATNLSYGGPKRVFFNFELQAPFPGAGNDRTLRLYSFIDTGNVFGPDESIDPSTFRAAGGLGISWISPLGPLRLAFAQPIRKQTGDKIQRLQFQIGTSF